MIGRTVRDNLEVFGSWEDMHVDIWGPRTGKTTSRAVPAILDAPGAVVATSNKRDIVDATRGPRRDEGPGLGVRPAGGLRGAAELVVEPAELRHRRDEGARAGGALRRLAAPGRCPDRRVLRLRRYRPAGWSAARGRGRQASDHPGLRVARRPAQRRAGADPAQHPGSAAVRGRAVRCHQRAGQAARRCLRHRAAERAVPDQPQGHPLGHPERAERQPAAVQPARRSSARAARSTACPRKAPVRRARWSPR